MVENDDKTKKEDVIERDKKRINRVKKGGEKERWNVKERR